MDETERMVRSDICREIDRSFWSGNPSAPKPQGVFVNDLIPVYRDSDGNMLFVHPCPTEDFPGSLSRTKLHTYTPEDWEKLNRLREKAKRLIEESRAAASQS